MVSKATAKVKGARIQRAVAEWYQRIWPAATTQGAGTPGRDVLNVPVSIEVKARRDFSPADWVRQARKRRRLTALVDSIPGAEFVDEFPPWVVLCPYGMDDASVADFMVIQDLDGHTAMVQELVQLRQEVASARNLCSRGCLPVVVPSPADPRGFLDGSQEAQQAQ
jgi:hypothetical protein